MYNKMFGEDKLHEECGVVGVYSEKPNTSAVLAVPFLRFIWSWINE